jgi:hypothetical protein
MGSLASSAPSSSGASGSWQTRNKKIENKVEKVGVFFATKKCPSTHHVLPAIHHNLTTKTPQQNMHFRKTPLQKHHSTTPEKNYRRKVTIGPPTG